MYFRNEINLLPIFGIFGYVNDIDCWIASIHSSVTFYEDKFVKSGKRVACDTRPAIKYSTRDHQPQYNTTAVWLQLYMSGDFYVFF